MKADITLRQAIQVVWPPWLNGGHITSLTRKVVDSARFDYRMTYNETRAAFGRAMGAPVDEAAFEAMMQALDVEE